MKKASIISLIVIGLISISLIGYYQLFILETGSPDWIVVVSDCRMPLRNPESSHDNNPTTRMLWNNLAAEDTCFSVLKWGFNKVQNDVYGIELDVMHEIYDPPLDNPILWLDKIEFSTDDVNYVEVWSGHESFAGDGTLTFETQSMKSAILSFSMDLGTRCGIAEIYFMQEFVIPPEIGITYTMTVITNPSNCEVNIDGVGTSNSGDVGVAVFEDVPYGSYDIVVSKSGYPSVTKTVFIDSDAVINIDITQTLLLVWFLLILIIVVVAVGVIIYYYKKG